MKSDTDIQHDIRDELAQVLAGNADKLDVQVLEGVVTLSGSANSDLAKWAVEDAVRRMPSVRALINEKLVVAPEAPARRADADTARPSFLPADRISNQRLPGALHAPHRQFSFRESQ